MQNIESISKSSGMIKAMVSDLAGGLKEIVFPASYLPDLIESGMAYDGSSFQGINNINASDAVLMGDAETLVQCDPSIADSDVPEYWIICDIYTPDGTPHPRCARTALKKHQEELGKVWGGGEMMIGAEPEAFFLDEEALVGNVDGGNANYFNPKSAKAFLTTEIIKVLQTMDFTVERGHTEVGADQFEINWEYDTAHRTADRIQMYKLICHKVARNFGLDVTFLPKPFPNRNGSGMHCHISVGTDKKNLFYDKSKGDQKFFSDTALHFLAGILKYTRSIAAVANPTEVSYARLVPGYEAPCVVAIGEFNRSAACRIPAIPNEKVREKALRTEFRFPDPLCNPYLLAHAFITAGIIGIQKKVKFKGFTDTNLYALSLKQLKQKRFKLLPRTLWEAYNDFSMHPEFIALFGEDLHEGHAGLVLDEIDACQPYANAESARRHYLA